MAISWPLKVTAIHDHIVEALNALKTALDSVPITPATPPGTIVAYGGGSIPSGWLLCNGQAVSQTTYSALYTAIGLAYGNPGGGNFNVPNFTAKRVPMGRDAGMAEIDVLGEVWSPSVDQGGDAGQPVGPTANYLVVNFIIKT